MGKGCMMDHSGTRSGMPKMEYFAACIFSLAVSQPDEQRRE